MTIGWKIERLPFGKFRVTLYECPIDAATTEELEKCDGLSYPVEDLPEGSPLWVRTSIAKGTVVE